MKRISDEEIKVFLSKHGWIASRVQELDLSGMYREVAQAQLEADQKKIDEEIQCLHSFYKGEIRAISEIHQKQLENMVEITPDEAYTIIDAIENCWIGTTQDNLIAKFKPIAERK